MDKSKEKNNKTEERLEKVYEAKEGIVIAKTIFKEIVTMLSLDLIEADQEAVYNFVNRHRSMVDFCSVVTRYLDDVHTALEEVA